MVHLRYTRNLILRGFCIVYLSAFLSFYVQIPGLYGDNGVLPAKSLLENSKHKTLSAKVHYQPTLLWLAPYLGLDTNYALDVLALLGTFLAFTGMVSQKFCTIPLFAGLWSLYFSLYQVGQTFVSASYDELLLEAGFLAILVAPLLPGRKGSKGKPTDIISFWLVRWLLFRYLLTCGLSKLISGDPKWWNLSALSYHFETMPLPSPLSWYSHHIPEQFLKLVVVFANISEIGMPFLFFVPLSGVKHICFYFQIFLQTCIVLTGNWDFSNILMAILLLSLLNDNIFYSSHSSRKSSVLTKILTSVFVVGFAYGIHLVYSFAKTEQDIQVNFAFSKSQFDTIVTRGLIYLPYFGLLTLAGAVMSALSNIMSDNQGSGNKTLGFLSTVFYAVIASLLFFSSTVPLQSLHSTSNSTINPHVRSVHNRLHKLHAVNQYGIFSKVISTGRSEIVLEGADNIEGPWKEFNFLYKPGNVNHSLPFIAPYSPKLDWQMYWAAYSTYNKQPWLLSLTHRLLLGKPEVLALLDHLHSPFAKNPPKYIRAILYKYKYTSWNQRSQSAWWTREQVKEYFPAYSKDSPALIDFLKARNLLPTLSKQAVNPIWKQALDSIRYVTNHLEATLLFWSVFTAGLALICTSGGSKK